MAISEETNCLVEVKALPVCFILKLKVDKGDNLHDYKNRLKNGK